MPSAIHNENALQTAGDIARALLTGFGHLKLPFTFATADAAVLFTVPATLPRVAIGRAWWEITTSFTGGATPAIAINSDASGQTGNGWILGGNSGDVTATLVSTGLVHKGGTIGAGFGSNGVIVLPAGSSIKFQRITSAFTAGSGFVHADFRLID